MSENPLQALLHTAERVSSSIQTHLSKFLGLPRNPSPIDNNPFSLSSSSRVTHFNTDPSYLHPSDVIRKRKSVVQPLSKEELGRATWTFLHTLAAQYPDNPTRQQKKDVKELIIRQEHLREFIDCVEQEIQERNWSTLLLISNEDHFHQVFPPHQECADHFKEVLRVNPVEFDSHVELSQWLCRVHNVVNRSLAKPVFPCERVDARWGKLECEDRACDVLGSSIPDVTKDIR